MCKSMTTFTPVSCGAAVKFLAQDIVTECSGTQNGVSVCLFDRLVSPPSRCVRVAVGSEAAVKASGKLRTEGKTYIVQDGDIMFFKVSHILTLRCVPSLIRSWLTSNCHSPDDSPQFNTGGK